MFEKLGRQLDAHLKNASEAAKVFGDMAQGAVEKVKELIPDATIPPGEPVIQGVPEHHPLGVSLAETTHVLESTRVQIRRILDKLGPGTPHDAGIYVGNMYTIQQLRDDLETALGGDG